MHVSAHVLYFVCAHSPQERTALALSRAGKAVAQLWCKYAEFAVQARYWRQRSERRMRLLATSPAQPERSSSAWPRTVSAMLRCCNMLYHHTNDDGDSLLFNLVGSCGRFGQGCACRRGKMHSTNSGISTAIMSGQQGVELLSCLQAYMHGRWEMWCTSWRRRRLPSRAAIRCSGDCWNRCEF